MNLVALGESIAVLGFMHPSELEQLVVLAANMEACEIGSFGGLSAWAMAITAKNVTCVDTFKANSAGQQQMPNLTTFDDFKRATARYSNVTAIVATSEEAAKTIPPSSFDFIFVDALHTYPEVRDDIQRWWPKLRAGGVMAFHDYKHADFPGVEQAVDEIFGPAPEGTTVVTLRWVTKPL